MTDTKVAAYVAKYTTKAAEYTGTLDRRVTPSDRLADLPVRDHARRHIAACLRLGKLPQLSGLRLAAWADMLGFRGHFSTKSRDYSITRSPPAMQRKHARKQAPETQSNQPGTHCTQHGRHRTTNHRPTGNVRPKRENGPH